MDVCDGEIDWLNILILEIFCWTFGTQNEQNLLSSCECSPIHNWIFDQPNGLISHEIDITSSSLEIIQLFDN